MFIFVLAGIREPRDRVYFGQPWDQPDSLSVLTWSQLTEAMRSGLSNHLVSRYINDLRFFVRIEVISFPRNDRLSDKVILTVASRSISDANLTSIPPHPEVRTAALPICCDWYPRWESARTWCQSVFQRFTCVHVTPVPPCSFLSAVQALRPAAKSVGHTTSAICRERISSPLVFLRESES